MNTVPEIEMSAYDLAVMTAGNAATAVAMAGAAVEVVRAAETAAYDVADMWERRATDTDAESAAQAKAAADKWRAAARLWKQCHGRLTDAGDTATAACKRLTSARKLEAIE